MKIERIIPRHTRHPAWANMSSDHPAEKASWIWAQTQNQQSWSVVRFHLPLSLNAASSFPFHISGDQRYQCYINDELVAVGPDRSDVNHWSIATYRAELPAGNYRFEVLVWWLPESLMPMAQMTYRAGFIFAGEGAWAEQLNTGLAPWQADDLSGAVHCGKPSVPGYHAIGPEFTFDMRKWQTNCEPVPVEIIRPPLEPERFGTRAPGWRLHPTIMPEQDNRKWTGGCARAGRDSFSGSFITQANTEDNALIAGWNGLLQQGTPLTIASNQHCEIIIDCESYRCGYPYLEVEKGRSSDIRIDWAESLFEAEHSDRITEESSKGQRDVIVNKSFVGIGDVWHIDGQRAALPALWWRSGRYLRVHIKTGDEPLLLHQFSIRNTGYPFQNDSEFLCDHDLFMQAWPVLAAGIYQCGHEQWVDCPYYEQLSYVGDNVCELACYCLTCDDRITKRSLELFDWSRQDGGWVAERYPSAWRQDSFTYALLYPRLVRDQAYWRDDTAFIAERLPGLRALMEECLSWRQPSGLVGKVPGWSFIDWVETWDEGCGPGVWEGDSSLVNFHLLFALRDFAAVEYACGDDLFAKRALRLAEETGHLIKQRYWCTESNLLADDGSKKHFSEHAQAWAILSGILTDAEQCNCLSAWKYPENKLAPASIYFSHYVLEAFYAMRAEKAFYDRLKFWEELPRQGFTTTPERPEPSRSDCHGWGAHPIFHAFASIAGIRPLAPGFSHVQISPMPGHLSSLNLSLPHPKGAIDLKWTRMQDCETYDIALPDGITGVWERGNQRKTFTGSLSGTCALPDKA